MMKERVIYTSYFAKFKQILEAGLYPVNISRKPPQFFLESGYPSLPAVFPSRDNLMTIKNSDMLQSDIDRYTEQYFRELKLSPREIIEELNKIVPLDADKVVLLCYEKPGDFCHRHLVADYLNQLDWINVHEYDFGDVINSYSLF